MADKINNVIENIKQGSVWMRIVLIAGFFIAIYVVAIVVVFITATQVLFSIFTGSDNRNLRLLGANLAEYVKQILKFITDNSEAKPFPFSAFPETIETEQSVKNEEDRQMSEADQNESATKGGLAELTLVENVGEVGEVETESNQVETGKENDAPQTPDEGQGGEKNKFDDLAFISRLKR